MEKKKTSKKLILQLLEQDFGICQLNSSSELPKWILENGVYFISKTDSIVSVLCPISKNEKYFTSSPIWSCFKLVGKFDFSATGILSSIINPLAKVNISILAYSTFETDYVFVEKQNCKKAILVFKKYFKVTS